MSNAGCKHRTLLRASAPSSRTAILLSVGRGDSHYRWGNQLLLPHHAIFMKHLADGLEVNISFPDKTETYTQNRTSKRIALSTSAQPGLFQCHQQTPPPPIPHPYMLMGLINVGPLTHVKCALAGVYCTL